MHVKQQYTHWQRSALSLLLMLSLLLAFLPVLTPVAQAQGEPIIKAADSDPYWRARYWNNKDLAGSPVLERDEQEINYNWGNGSPDNALPGDRFSARWTRYLDLEAGRYRFEANSDDGVRLYVDGQRIINGWSDHGVRTFSGALDLAAGHHLVEVEYYENEGSASIRVSWERLSGGGNEPNIQNWRGEYFNNPDLSGSPAVVRDDSNIDFNWGGGSPASGINNDNFSVRWTRSLNLGAGNYRFEVRVDDGVRLWVNNHLLIDQWRTQSTTTYRGDIYLPGGSVPIRVEYFERTGEARMRLTWTRTDQPSEPTVNNWRGEYFNNRDLSGNPTLVRDDANIDFDWGNGSPDGSINSDNFSVRWTRKLGFDEGRYVFTVRTDDGVRLYIDDRLVIDEWRERDGDKVTYEASLSKGNHKIRMEYFEKGGRALAQLSWKRVGDVQAPVGNLITCVPPQPKNYAWIKIYRLDGNNKWYSIGRGIGSVSASGFLKLDGLPVDTNRFGGSGEPYKIEQWVNGKVVQSTGDFYAGQPEFRLRSFADNYTPWQCQ